MRYIIITIFILSAISCSKQPSRLEQALILARENRTELEKVLAHYSNASKDSLKYKAAAFLIENMIGKQTLVPSSIASNQPYFDNLEKHKNIYGEINDEDFSIICDSLNNLCPPSGEKQPLFINDLTFISAKDLISHIDYLFKIREIYPWCQNVDFDTFCKYVLPYKVNINYWENTNSFFSDKYKSMIDTFSTLSYPEIGKYISKETENSFFSEWITLTKKYPYLLPATFENIAKTQIGSCLEMNSYAIMASRAMGIPASLNSIPCYGNASFSHFWTEIIDNKASGKKYDNTTIIYEKDADELVSGMFHIKTRMPSCEHISDSITIQHNRKMAKIYRSNYEIQEANLELLANKDIPVFFRNPGLEDITGKYIECKDVNLDLDERYQQEKTIYLCCYNLGEWTAVCWTKIENNKALFKQMGPNILYLPGYYKNDKIIPVGNPFILRNNGEIEFLPTPNTANKEKVILYSKLPLKTHLVDMMSKMIGCRFQLSNSLNFKDTATIHIVTKTPYYEDCIFPDTSILSRYVICNFEGLNEFCMAEWEIYGKDNNGKESLLKGKLVGNKGIKDRTIENTIDKDRVSYFQTNLKEKEQYIGIDLGKPYKITRIKYNPRSDDNRIVTNELYELYYWDKKWISLGKKEGENNLLVYDNVPVNALMRIHNHTRGHEHRIFTYGNGKQVWW